MSTLVRAANTLRNALGIFKPTDEAAPIANQIHKDSAVRPPNSICTKLGWNLKRSTTGAHANALVIVCMPSVPRVGPRLLIPLIDVVVMIAS